MRLGFPDLDTNEWYMPYVLAAQKPDMYWVMREQEISAQMTTLHVKRYA